MNDEIVTLTVAQQLPLELKVELQHRREGGTRIREISWDQGNPPTWKDCFSIDWGGGAVDFLRNALGVAAAGIFVEVACVVTGRRHCKQLS